MPVEQRTAKGQAHRITPEAVEAFRAGDFLRLHQALGLQPWEVSPLPLSIQALGCDQNPPPDWAHPSSGWFDSWEQAQELQRLLMKAAGR